MALTEQILRDIFVVPGHISVEDFETILILSRTKGISIEDALIQGAVLMKDDVGQGLAQAYAVPYCDLKKTTLSPKALLLVPERVARSQELVVFDETDEVVYVATTHPDNIDFMSMISRKANRKVATYYSLPEDLQHALTAYSGSLTKQIGDMVNRAMSEQAGSDTHAQPIVELVEAILATALQANTSDIHLEPMEHEAQIRFRIDGVLEKIAQYPKSLHEKVVTRIKILAQLRTDEQACSQDGRLTYIAPDNHSVDVRVSVVPITGGENVAMRILREGGHTLTLEDIGLALKHVDFLRATSERSRGMILAVGPTGSGKTTTLYTILKTLDSEKRNIMTIEDPVEYKMEHIQQIQVNVAKDLLFSTGLRTIVRQDPDVILVGEIRDPETADVAINAAMTGHLVLSTLHANDAATTFPRLAEMGIEEFLVASSVTAVIAQRLVRMICNSCRASASLDAALQTAIRHSPEVERALLEKTNKSTLEEVTIYHGKGCSACDGNGYRGRVGVFEILEVNEEVREFIMRKASASEIQKCAIACGMTSMLYDGIDKALNGTTTVDEILRLVLQ